MSLYARLGQHAYTYLLESVAGGEQVARYSFIGLYPYMVLTSKDGHITLDYFTHREHLDGNPLEVLRRLVQGYRVAPAPELPRFWGGAVGFFSYDVVRHLEHLPVLAEDDLGWPDCCFIFSRLVLVYDHVRHLLRLIYLADPAGGARNAYRRAEDIIRGVRAALARPAQLPSLALHPAAAGVPWTSNMGPERFAAMVRQAKEYIAAGDVLQVVLSQRLEAPFAGRPLDAYRALRSLNPSPYMYYLNLDGYQVIGASPEMLVRVEDGIVETRPIAGTRPRGATAEEENRLEEELRTDAKERAEHLMLVDLGRNDIGRVSRYGTVHVPQLMEVEKYSHVMHLVSRARGKLDPGKDALAALAACFPAGTVSGAPKVRAMEIIEELEPHRRGPYAGAVGYLGFGGNLDTCITIRTILLRGGRAYIQAGAGIVADSEPEREYQETLNKARALLEALAGIQEGERDACSY